MLLAAPENPAKFGSSMVGPTTKATCIDVDVPSRPEIENCARACSNGILLKFGEKSGTAVTELKLNPKTASITGNDGTHSRWIFP